MKSTINSLMLEYIENAVLHLDEQAKTRLQSFIQSKLCSEGGFYNKSDNVDPYYSVFGYLLCYVLNIGLDLKIHEKYISKLQTEPSDFVHGISIIKCDLLLNLIKYKTLDRNRRSSRHNLLFKNYASDLILKRILIKNHALLDQITLYQATDQTYHHSHKSAPKGSIYANYLYYSLLQEFSYSGRDFENIKEFISGLNSIGSKLVFNEELFVCSTASAALVLQKEFKLESQIFTLNYLEKLEHSLGGFMLTPQAKIPDLLSSATALFAFKHNGGNISANKEKMLDLVDMHWDESGGFFGSIADTCPDLEYTFYALLCIGICLKDEE